MQKRGDFYYFFCNVQKLCQCVFSYNICQCKCAYSAFSTSISRFVLMKSEVGVACEWASKSVCVCTRLCGFVFMCERERGYLRHAFVSLSPDRASCSQPCLSTTTTTTTTAAATTITWVKPPSVQLDVRLWRCKDLVRLTPGVIRTLSYHTGL